MEEKTKTNPTAFWQITFPLILGSTLIAALAVWAVIAAISEKGIRQQADTSAILLLAPLILISLVPLALTGLTAYAIIRLNKILPKYTRRGQELASQAEEKIKNLADKLAEPVFRIESFWASLRTLFRH